MSAGFDDERRLYECGRKYQIIVKQFDELIEMMDNRTKATRLLKRRRMSSSSSRTSNNLSTTATQPTSSCQQNYNDDGAFVQTITRFLHELRTDPTKPTDSSLRFQN